MFERGKRSSTSVAEIDHLATRERTRLWYRTGPATAEDRLLSQRPDAGPEEPRVVAEHDAPRPPTGQLRTFAALQSALAEAAPGTPASEEIDDIDTLTDWRDAPRYCPILLLSANQILDARAPGPLLGPGTSYRIVSIDDGVVRLQVKALDGQVGLGYCNAVDLMCYEPDIMYMRRDRQTGKRHTARLGLNRLSQRLSGVTGSLIG